MRSQDGKDSLEFESHKQQLALMAEVKNMKKMLKYLVSCSHASCLTCFKEMISQTAEQKVTVRTCEQTKDMPVDPDSLNDFEDSAVLKVTVMEATDLPSMDLVR